MDIVFRDEVYAIIGAAMDVYNCLGHGFLEAVYQEAFELELRNRDIPFKAQCPLTIHYKGQPLNKFYIADGIAFDAIVLEIKAADRLCSADQSQLLNYLKATGFKVGLLINFGNHEKLEWRRFAMTDSNSIRVHSREFADQ